MAQENKFPVIEIVGEAHMEVQPDLATVTMHIEVGPMPFDGVVQALQQKVSTVTKRLTKLGYSNQEFKTTTYRLAEDVRYENRKQVSYGYKGYQTVKLEFANKPEKIGSINQSFSGSEEGLRLSYGFKISDPLQKSTEEQLLQMAMKDAKSKALLLSKAGEFSLGSIQKVQYASHARNSPSPVYRAERMMMDASAENPGFQTEDQRLSEQVTVHYSIK